MINKELTITDNRQSWIRWELVNKPVLMGTLGIALLSGVYLGVLSILNSPGYAISQFSYLANWMIPLIVGFGIQLALFFYMRGYGKLVKQGIIHKGTVVASAGISTGAMIACCLHHAVEILPIIGLSALAAFLGQYQTFLLSVGIASNLFGISYLIYSIKKHNLFLENGLMAKTVQINSRVLFSAVGIISAILLMTTLFNQFL